MVFGPKSIGKPLLPMVLETQNHRKTIDINGEQRCMYNKNFVLQTVFYFQSDVKGVYSEVSLYHWVRLVCLKIGLVGLEKNIGKTIDTNG